MILSIFFKDFCMFPNSKGNPNGFKPKRAYYKLKISIEEAIYSRLRH